MKLKKFLISLGVIFASLIGAYYSSKIYYAGYSFFGVMFGIVCLFASFIAINILVESID